MTELDSGDGWFAYMNYGDVEIERGQPKAWVEYEGGVGKGSTKLGALEALLSDVFSDMSELEDDLDRARCAVSAVEDAIDAAQKEQDDQ